MDLTTDTTNVAKRAQEIMSSALSWDCHAGVACFSDLDLSFLSRWRDAGVSYIGLNVGWDALPWDEALRCAVHYRRWLEMHPDDYVLVERVADIHRAKREGKLAVTLDLEGANALDKNIELISMYYRLGVRHMNLAYNFNNEFAGGCSDPNDIPLTPLGRAAIAEINRVGMMVDVSHTGYRSSMEVMEISTAPVIFSHSNPRALWDHVRNITDDQIQASAKTGGVIGINGVSKFLGEDKDCTPETVIRNIEYVVNLVGVDHVGLGLDAVLDPEEQPRLCKQYPHIWPAAEGERFGYEMWYYIMPEQFVDITEGLLVRGYSDTDVKKILGENFIRVASTVWG